MLVDFYVNVVFWTIWSADLSLGVKESNLTVTGYGSRLVGCMYIDELFDSVKYKFKRKEDWVGDILHAKVEVLTKGEDGIDDNVESTSTFVHSTVALPTTRHSQPIQQCHSSLDSLDQST